VHETASLSHDLLRALPGRGVDDGRHRNRDPFLGWTLTHRLPLLDRQVLIQAHTFTVVAVGVESTRVDGILQDLPHHHAMPHRRAAPGVHPFLGQTLGDAVDTQPLIHEETEDHLDDRGFRRLHDERLAVDIVSVSVGRESGRHLPRFSLLTPPSHGPLTDLLLLVLGHRAAHGVEKLALRGITPFEVDELKARPRGVDLVCHQ
jgi:hypothetical protein